MSLGILESISRHSLLLYATKGLKNSLTLIIGLTFIEQILQKQIRIICFAAIERDLKIILDLVIDPLIGSDCLE